MSHIPVVAPVTKSFDYTIKDAFPDVDPQVIPLGHKILLHIRVPQTVTRGGVILAQGTQDFEKVNSQVAKVISLGPLAYKNRTTGESWPEKDWARPGEYVMLPQYAGQRWDVPYIDQNGNKSVVGFTAINDAEAFAKIIGDPLLIKATV